MENYYITFNSGEKFNITTFGVTVQEAVAAWQNPSLPAKNIMSVENGTRTILVNKQSKLIEAAGVDLHPSANQYKVETVDWQVGEIYI